MFIDRLYITGLGLGVYGVLYVPVLLLGLAVFYRKVLSSVRLAGLRWGVLLLVAALTLSLPLWDVLSISIEARRLCQEQGGLRVHRTAETAGFIGDSDIEFWSKHGFSYVESGGGSQMSRYTIQDGKTKHERVSEFLSRYELRSMENHVAIGKHFARTKQAVVDRQTGLALGELVYFVIYPGLWDGTLLRMMQAGPSLWNCGNEPPPGHEVLRLGGSDIVLATLKPRKTFEEETK